MKWTGMLAVGAASALVAVFGANLGGIHLSAIVRVVLLLFGLISFAFGLDRIAGVRIRAHLVSNKARYAAASTVFGFVLVAAFVALAYVFFTSLGTWTTWPPTTSYYDRLALAFRSGHIDLPDRPSPPLLALPNPYDPEARKGIINTDPQLPGSIYDMSMYRGRVYLYWGPAPALLLLALKAIVPVTVGDHILTFIFLLGAFVFESLLLVRLWRRFFADLPAWTVALGMLFTGLANPVPWLLFFPRIYEAAIAAGQFFLMAGLYLAFRALDRPVPSAWRLSLASIAFVCAVGSRATLAVAVAVLAFMVLAWLFWNRQLGNGHLSLARSVVAFVLPLVLGALLLGWYNFARFGSPLEFGFRYAITMLNQNRYHSLLFSPAFLLPNLYIYLLNPPELISTFPFVRPFWNGDLVAAFDSRFHSIYQSERTIGVIYVAPFLLFAFIPLAYLAWSTLRRRQAAPSAVLPPAERDPFFRWFLLSLSSLAIAQLLVVLLVYYQTMRYFLDASPSWALLSMFGLWLGYRRLRGHPFWKWIYILLAVLLVLVSIVLATLIGFSTDVPRLKAANPALLTHLRLFFVALARQLSR